MSDYQVTFARSARKELERLPSRDVKRVIAKITALTFEPRPVGCRKLVSEQNLWRIRIGEYRVVYSINDETKIIDIVTVRHRSEVYR